MREQPSIPTAISEPTNVIRPTTPAERILVIDILRGWAIFGILVVNMLHVSGYALFRENWTGSIDEAVAWSIQFFFRIKFVTLFSALFGLGFFLQAIRGESREINVIPLYLRRLLFLFLFGLLHVTLAPLEVLHQYALLGTLLLLFRFRSNPTILVAAVFFLLLPYVLLIVAPGVGQRPPGPDARLYSEGGIWEIGRFHFGQFLEQRSSLVGYVWMLAILPLMLLGLYVGKRGILQDVTAHLRLIRKSLRWGLAWGLGLTSMATVLPSVSDPAWAQWASLIAGVAFSVGGVGLSLFYASALVLLAQREKWKRRLAPLAAVGRMALTNYLLQTLISTSIFFGYGLGLYGTVGPTACLALTTLVFAFQVVFSVWWIGRFRFGPAEWLWRTLTYGKLQPIRL